MNPSEDSLREIEELCASRGVRLTENRLKVLRLILESEGALGAYDILAKLQSDQPRFKPPSVYRALNFLVAAGLVHKIESLSAYAICDDLATGRLSPPEVLEESQAPPGGGHHQLLICDECGTVQDFHAEIVSKALDSFSREMRFFPRAQVVEIHGSCEACSGKRESIKG